MSEKLTMPKNVQAFVNKYGRIGSKEQDATFWKEFRKAANAYADVQAKRICDLEHALTAVTAQRDGMEEKLRIELRGYPDSELWGDAGLIAATMRCVDALDVVAAQRDRLAEEVGQLKSRLTQTMGAVTISRNGYVQELEQQRDRLAEALETITITGSAQYCREIADEALQSLTPKP